jgi:hypothetical protein
VLDASEFKARVSPPLGMMIPDVLGDIICYELVAQGIEMDHIYIQRIFDRIK